MIIQNTLKHVIAPKKTTHDHPKPMKHTTEHDRSQKRQHMIIQNTLKHVIAPKKQHMIIQNP
jgi:hypothetical protein